MRVELTDRVGGGKRTLFELLEICNKNFGSVKIWNYRGEAGERQGRMVF